MSIFILCFLKSERRNNFAKKIVFKDVLKCLLVYILENYIFKKLKNSKREEMRNFAKYLISLWDTINLIV